MTIDEAKAAVGKLVLSRHTSKPIAHNQTAPHGPYMLVTVTKAGLAKIEVEGALLTVKPSELQRANANELTTNAA